MQLQLLKPRSGGHLGFIRVLVTALITFAATPAVASAADWPMAGYGPDHLGANPSESTLGPANVGGSTLAWSAPIGNDERCSPVSANGLVYDATQDYEAQGYVLRVDAFHADSGTLAWETKLVGEWCFGATPAIGGGLLFVPDSNNGNITALDATTGAVVWTHHFGGALYAPLTYATGTLYVGDGGGEVTAVDATTGTPRWSYGWGSCCGWAGQVETAPAVADGKVFFGSDAGVMVALDASSGSRIWSTPTNPAYGQYQAPFSASGMAFGTDNSLASSPTVAGGVIYIAEHMWAAGGTAELVAIDENTGHTLWTGALDTTGILSVPAVADGTVFVADRVGSGFGVHGHLWAFPVSCAGSCSPTWSAPTAGNDAAPTVANHVVYITSGPGNDIEAFATNCGTGGATCNPLWQGSRNVPGGVDSYVTGGLDSPIVVDGTIFANGWSADLPGHPALLAYRPTAPAFLPLKVSAQAVSAVEGQQFSGGVATFTDADNQLAGDYSATIDWGDGSPTTTGTLSKTGSGQYTIAGQHTYAEEGSYSVKVTVADRDTASDQGSSTATVADAPLSASGQGSSSGPVPTLAGFNGTVAAFTDANQGAPASDFTATIDWGDGSTSTGTVSGTGGSYRVGGGHTYASDGLYKVSVHVADKGGSSADTTTYMLVYSTLAHGSFVIGDQNAATGTQGTFWGTEWWGQNSLGGGSGPASFKGYAESVSGEPPACGQSWSTRPGDSSKPPAGPLPSYMPVIVSSSISKTGSTITGDTQHVVIVKTDNGYAPDPEHAGTGQVVAQLC